VTHSIFNSSTSLIIFVCSLLLEIHFPTQIKLSESHQGCGGLRKKLYCPLLYGDLIVKIKLDLGDHSEWIIVERALTLCELHNGDIDILYGWPNFRNKSCVIVPLILIYFMFLFNFVLT
jgi:hypothetical protein